LIGINWTGKIWIDYFTYTSVKAGAKLEGEITVDLKVYGSCGREYKSAGPRKFVIIFSSEPKEVKHYRGGGHGLYASHIRSPVRTVGNNDDAKVILDQAAVEFQYQHFNFFEGE